MKTHQPLCSWTLRSVIKGNGCRVITLRRTPGLNRRPPRLAVNAPAGQRRGGWKLRVEFAPEAASAFQPRIWRGWPAGRRLSDQLKLPALNPS